MFAFNPPDVGHTQQPCFDTTLDESLEYQDQLSALRPASGEYAIPRTAAGTSFNFQDSLPTPPATGLSFYFDDPTNEYNYTISNTRPMTAPCSVSAPYYGLQWQNNHGEASSSAGLQLTGMRPCPPANYQALGTPDSSPESQHPVYTHSRNNSFMSQFNLADGNLLGSLGMPSLPDEPNAFTGGNLAKPAAAGKMVGLKPDNHSSPTDPSPFMFNAPAAPPTSNNFAAAPIPPQLSPVRRHSSAYAPSSYQNLAFPPSIAAYQQQRMSLGNYEPLLSMQPYTPAVPSTSSGLSSEVKPGTPGTANTHNSDGPSNASTPTAGGPITKKRPRRRFDEIERNYICEYPGCCKGYGTLNHLNAHITTQRHGPKRTPADFKEARKQWREKKKKEMAVAAAEAAEAEAKKAKISTMPTVVAQSSILAPPKSSHGFAIGAPPSFNYAAPRPSTAMPCLPSSTYLPGATQPYMPMAPMSQTSMFPMYPPIAGHLTQQFAYPEINKAKVLARPGTSAGI